MDWNLSVNLFETTTRRRFPAMNALLEDHWSRCCAAVKREPADADFIVMKGRAEAARTAWRTEYIAWTASRGRYKGRTQAMQKLIADLRGEQISTWDIMVQATDTLQRTWRRGSPGHTMLFPQGRRPFQQGGIDERIAAVATLALTLSQVPVFAPVAALVSAFHSALRSARDEQQGLEGEVETGSGDVEAQRRAAAVMLQKNLGRLFEKYAETPGLIMTFFDLRDVRQPQKKAKPKA